MIAKLLKLIEEHKNEERISWEEYFMSVCLLVSVRSPSNKLKVGSLITNEKNRILSSGYNGFISGLSHISYSRDGHEINTVHAEINSILFCSKEGISTENCTMYVTKYPCLNCFKSIASCGIKEIIYLEDYNNDAFVQQFADEKGIVIRKVK
jgi:dCMP deaminase